jgi:hypothetical protein
MDNNKVQDNDALMGIEQAAVYLDVHPKFIRTRCSDKWLGLHPKFYRFAGRLKFRKSDLDEFIRFHENTPASDGKAE